MIKVRFLLDDVGQSQTQRSVLRTFAADLESQSLGEVVWTSHIPIFSYWNDVPDESSRRIGLRQFALRPEANQLTVFLPGHLVPGVLTKPININHALATASFSSVSGLDLCVINNAAPEMLQFQCFTQAHSDYESVSGFDSFGICELPDWLVSGGLKSCLCLADRPWYSIFAPTRVVWLAWIRRAMERGDLTILMVKSDISDGLVRPSLLDDVEYLVNNQPLFPLSVPTLDALFVFPECRLSNAQYQLLHSKALQMRMVELVSLQTARKLGKQKEPRSWVQRARSLIKEPKSWVRRARSLIKKAFKFAYLTAYRIYAISLRPLVKWLSNRGGT